MFTAILGNTRIRWTVIALLLASNIIMAFAGVYALKTSPTLFFDSDIITLREGIAITQIENQEIDETALWKLPVFFAPRKERAWWDSQKTIDKILKEKKQVVITFKDKSDVSWQVIANIGHLTAGDIIERVGLVYLAWIIYLISALTVYKRHPTTPGFVSAFFLSTLALYLITLTPVVHRPIFLDYFWLSILVKIFFVASTSQISMVHFAMIFPKRKKIIARHGWILSIFYGYSIAISLLYLLGVISLKTTLPLLIFWVVVMLTGLAHSMLKDPDAFMRKQMRMTFFAILLVSAYFVISMLFLLHIEENMLVNIALFSLLLPFSLILSLDNQQIYQDRIMVEINSRKEKERIHRELHDTVLNDLASISIVTEGALRFLNQDPKLVNNRLHQIKEYTADSSRQLRNFLWVIDDRHSTWDDVVDSLRRLGYDLLNYQDISFEIEINDDNIRIPLPSPSIKHAIYQVFREALINVSKHAKADNVLTTITFGKNIVVIVISDNGTGFEVSNVKDTSYGLLNIKNRIAENNGELVVKSSPGKGCQIIVQFPLK